MDIPKRYIGNNRWRVYHESGHADILTSASGDSTVYRYYVRDYLGSTRAVLAEDGTLLQDANYYPGGLSFSQLNDTEETDRLHCGKEWVDMEGLGWYDNAARFHDAILCRFTTPDPLAEQYPDLSPYSHCANNPLTIVDPDGRVLRDADGNIVYNTNKTEETWKFNYEKEDGSNGTINVKVEIGYIYANDGTPIQVLHNNTSSDARWDTNCHGVTFAHKKYWLPPESVQPLLDDEYTQVSISEVNMQNDVKTGPYIVSYNEYSDDGSIIKNSHTMTIIESDQTYTGTKVKGRDGPYPRIYSKNIVAELPNAAAINIYQKRVDDIVVSESEIKKLQVPKQEKGL